MTSTFAKIFRGELPGPDPACKKCKGAGYYHYDENHGTICDACCPHDEGFWLLPEGYANAGNLCCRRGCGFTKEKL